VGYVTCMDKKTAQRVLLGKPDENRPLGRLEHRQEDEIKFIKVIGWKSVDFIWLKMGSTMRSCEPSDFISVENLE